MKLLVVSHACANPINQQIYAQIQRCTDWQVTMMVPARWKDEFGNALETQLWPGFSAELISSPVWKNGNIILHGYRYPLKRLLHERHFDAIYVNQEPYAVSTAQLCRANQSTWRVPFGFYSAQNIRKSYPPPFCWLERWVYRHSQFAFPVTNDVGEVLRQKGYSGSLTVAPLAVDPSIYFPRSNQDAPPILQKATDEMMIGYVGRIVESKGLRTLVKALSKLRGCRWKLAVIGSGPFESEFDEIIFQAGLQDRVIRLGFVPHKETPRYLAALDVLVVPSETQANWKEQFGRVIVEALACGCPVIGSDSGEIPNLIQSSGGGLTFPERNADALSSVILRMAEDEELRLRFAHQGQRWAVEKLSITAVAELMIHEIEGALETVGGNPSFYLSK